MGIVGYFGFPVVMGKVMVEEVLECFDYIRSALGGMHCGRILVALGECNLNLNLQFGLIDLGLGNIREQPYFDSAGMFEEGSVFYGAEEGSF